MRVPAARRTRPTGGSARGRVGLGADPDDEAGDQREHAPCAERGVAFLFGRGTPGRGFAERRGAHLAHGLGRGGAPVARLQVRRDGADHVARAGVRNRAFPAEADLETDLAVLRGEEEQRAVVDALKQLEEPEEIAARRGLSLEEVAPDALLRARAAGIAEARKAREEAAAEAKDGE